jgi:transposase-like protein
VEPINLTKLARYFSDEAAAWEYVENLRWPNGPECPHCGCDRAYFLNARSGQRTTKKGTTSYRRLWKCAGCRKQYSVLVGSIFEDTKLPLSKWLLAVYMMCASKNGVAAYELHRTLGVTNKTAWFMNHRIRAAMTDTGIDMMRGTVVADETYVGGLAANRHGSHHGGQGRHDKAIVLTLIDKERGEARSRVIPDVTGATLRKAIAEHVDMANTTLMTDEGRGYKTFQHELAALKTVNHSASEYAATRTARSSRPTRRRTSSAN